MTALKFAELVVKAGFPPGVINILPGPGKKDREKKKRKKREPLLWTGQMSYVCDCLGREVE